MAVAAELNKNHENVRSDNPDAYLTKRGREINRSFTIWGLVAMGLGLTAIAASFLNPVGVVATEIGGFFAGRGFVNGAVDWLAQHIKPRLRKK